MSLVQKLTNTQKAASYDYKKGWATTAQPFSALTVEEYHEIATAAADDLSSQMHDFLNKNNFTYIEIPHSAFFDYELSKLNFREWLNQYCDEQNEIIKKQAKASNVEPILMDHRAHFAIIKPRIKTLESAKRKTATGQKTPERIVDYLGTQLISLKQTSNRKNKTSLDIMARAMTAIEGATQSLARKNHYWDPHTKTKFRGHKTLRIATVPEEHALSGFQVLAEIKIEHESQMDIDKLTRKFINIGRSAQRAFEKCFATPEKTPVARNYSKRSAKLCRQEHEKQRAVDALGGMLYNRVFTDIGMNRFMNPRLMDDFSALPIRALLSAAKETVAEHFSNGCKRDLLGTITNMEMFGKREAKRPAQAQSTAKQMTRKHA